MKVVILSFTQAGTRLGERIGSQFRNEGITCQNYAPAGYAFAGKDGERHPSFLLVQLELQ